MKGETKAAAEETWNEKARCIMYFQFEEEGIVKLETIISH